MTKNWLLQKSNRNLPEGSTFVVYSDNQVIVEILCFRNIYISLMFSGNKQ